MESQVRGAGASAGTGAVLGEAANGPRYRIAATAVVVGVATMSSILLVQTILGWFGLG